MNGQYAHNIDAKGRLFIPTKLRDELGGTLHVTVGQDHCLSVFSDQGWADFNASLKGTSFTRIKGLRMMYAYMTDCVPDAQGRILLPAKLRQYANLEKEVVIIGVFDRAEIWNAQLWQKMEDEALQSGSWRKQCRKWGCEPWHLTETKPLTWPSATARCCWMSVWRG